MPNINSGARRVIYEVIAGKPSAANDLYEWTTKCAHRQRGNFISPLPCALFLEFGRSNNSVLKPARHQVISFSAVSTSSTSGKSRKA